MPQTIRIDSDCKRANALFDTEYPRGMRDRGNPIMSIKARSMRRGKERQERGQFHGRKNAKLAHLIRDTHNCRGATQLFSQICAAYATPHEQFKRNMRESGVARDNESDWRSRLTHQPAAEVRERGKSSASRDP